MLHSNLIPIFVAETKRTDMEGFLALMVAWLIVYLATRKSSRRRGMSQYEKDRIRRANKRLIEEEKRRNKKIRNALYDLLWGSNKSL